MFVPTLVITLILAGIISALHYWPLSPITYGLLVLGPAYSLTSLIAALSEDQPFKKAFVEPVLMLAVLWGTAILIA
jgi:hypothetical protein